MKNLLFSPTRRIEKQAFHKGAVILLALNFFGWLAWYGGFTFGILTGLLSFVLIYCWGCLFAKRLHDAGKPGWLYIPIFIAFLLAVFLLTNVLITVFTPEIVGLNQEYQQMATSKPETMEEMMAMMKLLENMYRKISMPAAISFLLSGALVGFGINAALRTEPNDNQYGPAT